MTSYLDLRNSVPKRQYGDNISLGDWLVFSNSFTQATAISNSQVCFIGKASLTIIVESIGYNITQIGFANADIFTVAIKLYRAVCYDNLGIICVVPSFNLADHVCYNWVWSDFFSCFSRDLLRITQKLIGLECHFSDVVQVATGLVVSYIITISRRLYCVGVAVNNGYTLTFELRIFRKSFSQG